MRKLNIQAVTLIANYPIVQVVDGKVHYFNLLDTVSIYYVNEYVAYQLPGKLIYETNERADNIHPYFIYRKKNNIGVLYDSLQDAGNGTRAPVDSFLFKRAHTGLNISFSDPSWFKSDSIREGHQLIEKFAPRIPSGAPEHVDSAFFYYSELMNDVEYSFTRSIDSAKNMKLFKIRLLYNEKYSKEKNLVFPAREIFFTIQKKTVTDADSSIVNFVSRYDKIYAGGK